MNYRIIETGLKVLFLISSSFIAADIVNTAGRGAMIVLPPFSVPDPPRRHESVADLPVSEENNAPSAQGDRHSFRLIGTVTGAYPYIILADPAGAKQDIYRLKEDAGDGWIVQGIGKNRAVMKKGDVEEVLEVALIDGEQKGNEQGVALKAPPTKITLSSRDVEDSLSDLNRVMTQARVVPAMTDGKTTGYRVFNIVPGSIYAKIGLRDYDAVERINGVEIKGPDTLYGMFQQIKNERRIVIDVSRGGKKESITIDIR